LRVFRRFRSTVFGQRDFSASCVHSAISSSRSFLVRGIRREMLAISHILASARSRSLSCWRATPRSLISLVTLPDGTPTSSKHRCTTFENGPRIPLSKCAGGAQAVQPSASGPELPAQAGGRSLGLCHFALSPEPATLRQTFARRRQTAGSLIAKASFSQCRCAVGAYSNGSSTCRNKRSSRFIAGYDNRNLVLG